MSEKYKVQDSTALHFITITITGWVDLFIRIDYKDCIISSLKYCQSNKGLKIYVWVIMSSHIHLIVSTDEGDLPSIARDFKTFTSKELLKLIKEIPESRREWMLKKFAYEANRNIRGSNYKLWQDGFHPVELSNNKMKEERLNYIHQNPVESGIVFEPEDYVYGSAKDYTGKNGLLDLSLMN